MPAVAMTDHGNVFGAVNFYNAAKNEGIKPIIGCELYICKKDDKHLSTAGRRHLQPSAGAGGERRGISQPGEDHVGGVAAWLLLQAAREQEISGGALQGADWTFGLPEGRGCREPDGREVRRRRASGCTFTTSSARQFLYRNAESGVAEGTQDSSRPVPAGARAGYSVVATNDSHYLCEDDAHAQDAMLCIQTGKSIQDKNG